MNRLPLAHWTRVIERIFSPFRKRRTHGATRLAVEVLGDRVVPATFTPLSNLVDGSLGSLRSVITQANKNSDPVNTITLSAGTYTLSLQNPFVSNPTTSGTSQDNVNATGDLDIFNASGVAGGRTFIIQGAGQDKTFVNAQSVDRVFHVLGDGITVEFKDLTIQGGAAADNGVAGSLSRASDAKGGGILVSDSATVNLTGVTITGNGATAGQGKFGTSGTSSGGVGTPGGEGGRGFSSYGGGVYVDKGILNVGSGSVISSNRADGGSGGFGGGGGGGSQSGGSGGPGGPGGDAYGGGIAGSAAGGQVFVLGGAVVSGNTATGGSGGGAGGAGSAGASGGTGGPAGNGFGGGIATIAPGSATGASLTLTSSKVSENRAVGGRGGQGGFSSTSPGNGGTGGAASGGGVSTDTGLLSTGVQVLSNTADAGEGGGISVVENAPTRGGDGGRASGGGVDVSGGPATIKATRFSANSAQGGAGTTGGAGARATGGGIVIKGNTVIDGSSFSRNSAVPGSSTAGAAAESSGGAVADTTDAATITIANSTFDFNTIGASEAKSAGLTGGGAISFTNPSTIRNSTIVRNSTTVGGKGGGLESGGAVTLVSSIVGLNTSPTTDGSAPVADISSLAPVAGTNNLVETANGFTGIQTGVDGNVVGKAFLNPLFTSNGGNTVFVEPVQTGPNGTTGYRPVTLAEFRGLPAGSLTAIDQGATSGGVTVDQFGSPRVVGAAADIGAIESNGPPDTAGAQVAAAFSGVVTGTFDKVTVTFSEPMQVATFTTADVTLLGADGKAIVVTVTPQPGSTTVFDLTFALQANPGKYTITIGTDILDVAGNKMDQNKNGLNAETGDTATFTGTLGTVDTAGAQVVAPASGSVFSGGSATTFDTATLLFSEPILATSFGVDDVTLTGPGGVKITPSSVTAGSAVNGLATQFKVAFPVQAAAGAYTITTGVDILDAAGNKMDQNKNGTNGEAADGFTGTGTLGGTTGGADTAGAQVQSVAFAGATAGAFDTATFVFSEPVLAISFGTDDVVTLAGPGGVKITPSSVTAGSAVNGLATQFKVAFPVQAAAGAYTITTGVDILDAAGNKMDQNKNGTNGEAADGFTFSGTLTSTGGTGGTGGGPRVNGSAFAGTTASLTGATLIFDRAVDPSTFTPADVALAGPRAAVPVTSVRPADASNTRFEIAFAAQTAGGVYTLTVGPDVRDPAGLPMDQNGNKVNGESQDFFRATKTLQGQATSAGLTQKMFAVGQSNGSVRVLDAEGGADLIPAFRPFDVGEGQYTGLVQVAVGDMNGDGTPDLLVAAANPAGTFGLDGGKAGKVYVYDGKAFAQEVTPTDPILTFVPFAKSDGPGTASGLLPADSPFVNGLNITVADVTGDGRDDLVAGTRGNTATAGNRESGRVAVVDGATGKQVGDFLKPFGPGYEKGVVIAAGDFDGDGKAEVAVTRGGPVASTNKSTQTVKLKVYKFADAALTELNLTGATDANGDPVPFAPFAKVTNDDGAVIQRDARVTAVNQDGDGKDELVFTALDDVTDPANKRVRVGAYSITAAGLANLVSTGPTSSLPATYLAPQTVVDHAISRVNLNGDKASDLALVVQLPAGAKRGKTLYLNAVTGEELVGGFDFNIIPNGISVAGSMV